MAMFEGNGRVAQMGRGMQMADDALSTLEEIRDDQRSSLLELAVSNVAPKPSLLKDFPVPGAAREILFRRAVGGDLEVPEKAKLIVPHNVNRIGLTIVNYGTKLVKLFLATEGDAQTAGALAMVALNAEGGAWDGRLGNMLWAGSVAALAVGGASNVTVAEV